MRETQTAVDGADRRKLLIVDDDSYWAEALRKFLSDKYEVEVVNSAAEAIDRLRYEAPAAIIVDLVMPVIDGFGLMRRLSDGASAPVPMILLTGWKTAEVEQCAASFGCAAVLGKTIDPGILEQVVASVIEH